MPKPIVINGDVWRVIRVPAGDPRLIDRTGTARLATTDQRCRSVFLLETLVPPMLDRVLLHEIGHAVTISYGILPSLRRMVLSGNVVGVEEWAAGLMENYSIEAVAAAKIVLGRPPCVRGKCG